MASTTLNNFSDNILKQIATVVNGISENTNKQQIKLIFGTNFIDELILWARNFTGNFIEHSQD